MTVQPDDKILVSGYSSWRNKDLATVARFTSNGAADTTFGANGRATVDFLGNGGWDVDVANSGFVYISGSSGTSTLISNASVARFTPGGQLDGTFGVAGVATFDSGTGDSCWRMGLQPDGKILVTGNTISGSSSVTANLLTARFDSAGNVDSSFGNLGGAITDFYGNGETSRGVFVQNLRTSEFPDYRIVVAGMAQGSGNSKYAFVARYLY